MTSILTPTFQLKADPQGLLLSLLPVAASELTFSFALSLALPLLTLLALAR
jgi:hypothetical protein